MEVNGYGGVFLCKDCDMSDFAMIIRLPEKTMRTHP